MFQTLKLTYYFKLTFVLVFSSVNWLLMCGVANFSVLIIATLYTLTLNKHLVKLHLSSIAPRCSIPLLGAKISV